MPQLDRLRELNGSRVRSKKADRRSAITETCAQLIKGRLRDVDCNYSCVSNLDEFID